MADAELRFRYFVSSGQPRGFLPKVGISSRERQYALHVRLLEMPKPRLKSLQRTVLRRILNRVVAHEAAHAFRPGRSIVSFVEPHTAKRVVLRIDLRNFFPSVQPSRVFTLFRTIGYPEAVARLLSGLCTNSVPYEILSEHNQDLSPANQWRVRKIYGSPHLPQGAPTSPALANLAAWRLDCRLSGLATATGADYTRYADDLVFSGGRELERCLPRFRVLLLAIVLDEGFAIRNRKTCVMRASGRQQVAGVLVNERPNIDRAEFDRLKAMLFNCARHGPRSQLGRWNAAAGVEQLRNHLTGKIAFVRMINPAKAERLRRLFDEIDWDPTTSRSGRPNTPSRTSLDDAYRTKCQQLLSKPARQINEGELQMEDGEKVLCEHASNLCEFVRSSVHEKGVSGVLVEACRALFTRVVSGFCSTYVLRKNSAHDWRVDGVVLLRTCYDPMIQLLYMLKDPDKRRERAESFMNFEYIERFHGTVVMETSDTFVADRVRNSELRNTGEPELKKKLEKIGEDFLTRKGKNELRERGSAYLDSSNAAYRDKWYVGNLDDLAETVGYLSEYKIFQKNTSACVHASPLPLNRGTTISPEFITHIASTFALRAAGAVADTFGVVLNHEDQEVIELVRKNIYGEPPNPGC